MKNETDVRRNVYNPIKDEVKGYRNIIKTKTLMKQKYKETDRETKNLSMFYKETNIIERERDRKRNVKVKVLSKSYKETNRGEIQRGR